MGLDLRVGGKLIVEIASVGEVTLVELLGTGGFGSVWKVVDTRTNNIYVLKVIQNIESGSLLAERVRLEAGVSIPSQYIIPVVGLRQWNLTTFFLLFEYFPGYSLDRFLTYNTLSSAQKGYIFYQILVGVGDAHRCNIIHRDLKPANILLGTHDEVKIIDFGISKFKDYRLTVDKQIFGTIPYIAPELLFYGAKIADARADIYALGHILYQLATGEHFWVRKNLRNMDDFFRYLKQTPAPTDAIELDGLNCDFIPNATTIISRMVKVDPNQRFASIQEILHELGYVTTTPVIPPQLNYPLLIVQSGTNKGATSVINIDDKDVLVLGRAEIAGSDDSISRRHLEFTRLGNQYFVRDVGSKNGTLVRGIALSSNGTLTLIQHRDHIKVGDVFLQFVIKS
ncbi:serine/threonine protein kinase [Calothrix sp. NIES-4071]|nr:serine/threonine protein kinase [Calothrix sp. NIES-4071]BAZ55349.1 serine/threonine protein kinase [Calothrix sp. NIES-4105]